MVKVFFEELELCVNTASTLLEDALPAVTVTYVLSVVVTVTSVVQVLVEAAVSTLDTASDEVMSVLEVASDEATDEAGTGDTVTVTGPTGDAAAEELLATKPVEAAVPLP